MRISVFSNVRQHKCFVLSSFMISHAQRFGSPPKAELSFFGNPEHLIFIYLYIVFSMFRNCQAFKFTVFLKSSKLRFSHCCHFAIFGFSEISQSTCCTFYINHEQHSFDMLRSVVFFSPQISPKVNLALFRNPENHDFYFCATLEFLEFYKNRVFICSENPENHYYDMC